MTDSEPADQAPVADPPVARDGDQREAVITIEPADEAALATDTVVPTEPVRPVRPSFRRLPVYVAAALVVVLGGGGLFASGFLLGRESALAPGAGDARQAMFQPFWDTYNDIVSNYVGQKDEHKLVEGAIKGLFEALGDPFSFYMTQEEYEASLTSVSGEFEGIGAEMATQDSTGKACDKISDTCLLAVVKVIRDSPALRAGLLAGDTVTAVDGKSLTGDTVSDAVNLIRGPKGSVVTLSLLRAGAPLQMPITRDTIVQEDVSSQVMANGKLGYIKINSFSEKVGDDLATQLKDLIGTQHVSAIVLDLRDDPGGLVDQARAVASQFTSASPLYWEQSAGADPVPQPPIAGGVATDTSIPMVVLVNGGTASASEIVAAALQGNHRAQLVGQKTYGKGTIQEWKPLAGAGGYRLSVRKWLTPNQTWIHGVGLTPDVDVEVPANNPAGSDPVLDKAIQMLTNPGSGTSGAVDSLPLAA